MTVIVQDDHLTAGAWAACECTDHWTTGQSHGVGMPMVQLTMHVKSSTLYGCTVVHPNFFGLMGYYYFV